jgi:predicted RNA binding protein YcfA (HicA-like mRNA interferase family)
MKTPRDVSGAELVKALRKFGYDFLRQAGSHIMIQTEESCT